MEVVRIEAEAENEKPEKDKSEAGAYTR